MILVQSVLMWTLEKDLAWWVELFGQWNGISFFLFSTLEPLPDFSVCSDASGVIGYGASMDNEWFSGQWFPLQIPLSIAYKELFPVVLAAHVWSPCWSARGILFQTGNEKVVHILNSRTSPDLNFVHLLHSLLKIAACFSFTFAAIHFPGKNNGIADACLISIGRDFFLKGHVPRSPQSSSLLSYSLSSPQSSRSLLLLLHVPRLSCLNALHLFLCSGKVHNLLHHDQSS